VLPCRPVDEVAPVTPLGSLIARSAVLQVHSRFQTSSADNSSRSIVRNSTRISIVRNSIQTQITPRAPRAFDSTRSTVKFRFISCHQIRTHAMQSSSSPVTTKHKHSYLRQQQRRRTDFQNCPHINVTSVNYGHL
jgi:hypothetical protein